MSQRPIRSPRRNRSAPSADRAGTSSPASPKASSRRVAYQILLRIDHEGAYANLALGPALERSGLDPRDRAFATDLVYGTTRMRRACDALVDRFISSDPRPEIRTALRLGAYQLHFAGVSPHAAVGETVSLVQASTRGFVNAVLRRVADTPMTWPNDVVKLSYPDWLVERLRRELGPEAAMATLATMNTAPLVSERADGYIQDIGSQWTVGAVDAQPGDMVLDVCAAPGGKATAMAAAGAFVVAADLQPHRLALIVDNARDTDVVLAPVVADGLQAPFATSSFDRVLLDAPCSGLGSLRRRADARWRIQESDITELASLQRRLLAASAPLVKPGGMLVYSVCTLVAAESTDHPTPDGFDVVAEAPSRGPWQAVAQGFRLLPHLTDTDGMTIVRYRRREDPAASLP